MYRIILCVAAALSAFGVAVAPVRADDNDTCRYGTGDTKISACSRVIQQNPKNASAFNSRGFAYNGKGDYDRAISDLDQAIRIDPKNAVAYNNRGVAYDHKGEHDRAIADLNQAIRLDPKYAIAYNSRGNAHENKGDHDRAIADFDEAIRLAPNAPIPYAGRGGAYDSKGDHDRAIADYNNAVRLDPKYATAYRNRGIAYYNKGDYDRAIADYDEAIRLDPKEADAYSDRGSAYYRKGDYDHAVADFDAAIKLNPALAVAQRNRAIAQQDRDRARAASDLALGLAQQSPERAQAALARPQTTGPQAALAAPSTLERPAAISQPAPPPLPVERRVALVIGNSEYRAVPALSNPRRDATAVAEVLRQTGFQVVELATDLDRDGMIKALRTFRDKADGADWALVYFAGHGIEIDRVNYLIPVDAKLADDRDVRDEAVSYEAMLRAISGARALRLIVLDACRVNPFKERMRRTVASRSVTDRGLAPPAETEPGTLVVYSAKEGEVAADDVDGVNSPFAKALVAELKVPGLEVRRVFDNVRDDVIEATRKRQQPFTYGSLPGRRDFFFVAGK